MNLYEHLMAELAGRDSRKVANNTYVERLTDDAIGVRLHSTYIIEANKVGTFSLDSGGYLSRTTKDRMNSYLRHTANFYQIDGSTISGWTGDGPRKFRPWQVVQHVNPPGPDFWDDLDATPYHDGMILQG